MSVEEAKATIRKGVEACGKATSAIREVGDLSNAAHTLARATAHGSQHEEIKRGFDRLAQVAHEIELVLRRLRAAADAADRYLGVLG